jgi:hypothetical protein
LWQLHSKTHCYFLTTALFSIAEGAITELMIASVFDRAPENLRATSESGNILLYRTEVQSAVLLLLRCLCLEAFMVTGFSEMFSGRQLNPDAKVF